MLESAQLQLSTPNCQRQSLKPRHHLIFPYENEAVSESPCQRCCNGFQIFSKTVASYSSMQSLVHNCRRYNLNLCELSALQCVLPSPGADGSCK